MCVAWKLLMLGNLIILTSQIVTVATGGPADNAKLIDAPLLQDHAPHVVVMALKTCRQALQGAILANGATGIYVAVR